MSQNVFPVDSIFCIPIDSENNKNFQEEQQKSDILENENSLINETFKKKENKNNKNILTFSLDKNDKNIKSMTNSSKIYISEIFKKNWKLKSRRLMAKLKKRLIKQMQNYNSTKSKNEKSNFIENNFVNQVIIKSNNINNGFNNFWIYNKCNNINNFNQIDNICNYNNNLSNINCKNFNNNFNINNVVNESINNIVYNNNINNLINSNIYTNFNFNFNQFNNNLNIEKNNNISIINNNNNIAYNLSKNHY